MSQNLPTMTLRVAEARQLNALIRQFRLCAVADRLGRERIHIREALGYGTRHYPLADHYDSDRWMYGDAHKQLVKSGNFRENIGIGVSSLESV